MAAARFYRPPGARARATAVPTGTDVTPRATLPGAPYPQYTRPRGAGLRYAATRAREAMRQRSGQPLGPLVLGDTQPTTTIDLRAIYAPTNRRLGDDLARFRSGAPASPPAVTPAEPARPAWRQPREPEPLDDLFFDEPAPAPAEVPIPAPRRSRPAPVPTRRRRRNIRAIAIAAGGVAAVVLIGVLAVLFVPPLRTAFDLWGDVFQEPTATTDLPAIVAVDALGNVTIPTLAPAAPAPTLAAAWTGNVPLTILLVGVDRRDGQPAFADTIVLARIDGPNRQVTLLSLPRATLAIVPGRGLATLGGAYALGDANGQGAALLAATIEANFGVPIDHIAEVDFAGFVALVDDVGGVIIDNPYPIKDDAFPTAAGGITRIVIPAGWQQLDANEALVYVRTRNDDGDAVRAQRQLQVLLAIRDQALRLDLLPQAEEIIGNLGAAIRTDLSPAQMLELARIAVDVPIEAISRDSLQPALTATPGGVLVPDWALASDVLSRFAGVRIVPPAAALAAPDVDTPILVRDASGADLAPIAAARLTAAGFRNVRLDGAMAGEIGASVVVDGASDLATATLVANALGVGADALAGLDASVDGVPLGPLADANLAIIVVVGQDLPADPGFDPVDSAAIAGAQPAERRVGRLVPPPVTGGEIGANAIALVALDLPATGERSADAARGAYASAGDASGGPDPEGNANVEE